MARRRIRTPIVALLLVGLALGMYGAGRWVAAQIGQDDGPDNGTAQIGQNGGRDSSTPQSSQNDGRDNRTPQSAAEAAATLAAEAAEDAKLPRVTGPLGSFEVTSDDAKYSIDVYFPCEPGYATEFDPRPLRDSELNFVSEGPIFQVVCADGTVRMVYGGGVYRAYFIQARPYAYADAPAGRLQTDTIEGRPALMVRPVHATSAVRGNFGQWRLYVLERESAEGKPGILLEIIADTESAARERAKEIVTRSTAGN
jgi:hypothetical protein